MSEPKFQMSINLQVLNHLGLNLYSNTSAVLSEVVANAWDADAKEVHISIDSDSITIIDNGTGMDLSDINNKYLTVGYQKRSESGLSPILHRPVMGRKGIGKLSLFSIANIVKVFSRKNDEINGFRVEFKEDNIKIGFTKNSEFTLFIHIQEDDIIVKNGSENGVEYNRNTGKPYMLLRPYSYEIEAKEYPGQIFERTNYTNGNKYWGET